MKRYKNRGELAMLKTQMLEIYIADMKITDTEMAARLDIDAHTVAKWRREWEGKLSNARTQTEQKIIEKVKKTEGMWQKLSNLFK